MSTLIALGGALRSGKGEVAKRLVTKHNYVAMGMSDPLNAALLALNPIIMASTDNLPSHIEGAWGTKNIEMVRYVDMHEKLGYVEAKKHPEVRRLLQALGTEVGRDMIGENTWTDIATRTIHEHWAQGRNVVIDGIRFPNELQMVKNLHGALVWVDRSAELRGVTEDLASHASEKSVGPDDFDYILKNDNTLRELGYRVEDILLDMRARTPETLAHKVANRHENMVTRLSAEGTAEEMIAEDVWPDYDR